MSQQHVQSWQSKGEQTNSFWLTALLTVLRVLGRNLCRWLILPFITLFYFLWDGNARVASRDFLTRAGVAPVGWREIYHHMYTFASVSMDRFLILGGGMSKLDIELVNEGCFDELDNGALLITSHFGSFDVMRVLAVDEKALQVHILLDKHYNASTMKLLQRLNPELAELIIDAADAGPQLVLKLSAILSAGKLIGVMADRAQPQQRQVQKQFLGAAANFPLGPWQLAAVLRCPVILCAGVFQGGRRYRVSFDKIDMSNFSGPSRERADQGLTAYVRYLENQAQQSPLNWFNFYDFWMQAPSTETASSTAMAEEVN